MSEEEENSNNNLKYNSKWLSKRSITENRNNFKAQNVTPPNERLQGVQKSKLKNLAQQRLDRLQNSLKSKQNASIASEFQQHTSKSSNSFNIGKSIDTSSACNIFLQSIRNLCKPKISVGSNLDTVRNNISSLNKPIPSLSTTSSSSSISKNIDYDGTDKAKIENSSKSKFVEMALECFPKKTQSNNLVSNSLKEVQTPIRKSLNIPKHISPSKTLFPSINDVKSKPKITININSTNCNQLGKSKADNKRTKLAVKSSDDEKSPNKDSTSPKLGTKKDTKSSIKNIKPGRQSLLDRLEKHKKERERIPIKNHTIEHKRPEKYTENFTKAAKILGITNILHSVPDFTKSIRKEKEQNTNDSDLNDSLPSTSSSFRKSLQQSDIFQNVSTTPSILPCKRKIEHKSPAMYSENFTKDTNSLGITNMLNSVPDCNKSVEKKRDQRTDDIDLNDSVLSTSPSFRKSLQQSDIFKDVETTPSILPYKHSDIMGRSLRSSCGGKANDRLKRLRESMRRKCDYDDDDKIINDTPPIYIKTADVAAVQEPMEWEDVINVEPKDSLAAIDYDDIQSDCSFNESLCKTINDNIKSRSEMKTAVGDDAEEWLNEYYYIVLDTNVLLRDLDFLDELVKMHLADTAGTIFFIPYCVLQELDRLKSRTSDQKIQLMAIRAIKYLNRKFEKQNKHFKAQNAMEDNELLIHIESSDDCIINCCLQLKIVVENMLLLTNDVNLKNKAIVNSVGVFTKDELVNSN